MKRAKYISIISIYIIAISAGLVFGFWFAKKQDTKEPKQAKYHYSPITQKDYFENFFASVGDCENNYNSSIKGLIVNHHLLASKFIAQGICQIASHKKITIVLISPNHFNHGDSIVVSNYDWHTPYGILRADTEIIKKLAKSKIISIDENPFEYEHGIYNITPFIKKAIPNATIIPILIKDNVSPEKKEALIKLLKENFSKDAIIVASLDFSHYLTSDEADKMDIQTLEIINKLDFNKIKDLNPNGNPDNIDSKPTLEILLNLMSENVANNFELLAHSNSAKLIGNLDLKETTSYIVGYFFTK